MHKRLRRTLVVLALVFFVGGVLAFAATAWNTYDVVSSPQVDANGNVIDGSGPTKTYLVLSMLLPALGVAGFLLGVLCAAGVILSFVLVDALGAPAPTEPVVPDQGGPAGGDPSFGPPELLDGPRLH